MGQEFAIIFDVVIVVIIVGFFFAGWKNGFAKVIIGMAAIIVAFACALWFSEPIASAIYEGFIEKPVEEQIDKAVDAGLSSMDLGSIPDIDFSKVEISGVPVTEINPNYAGTGKAVIDLSDVDLSKTGIGKDDLKALSPGREINISSINAKMVDFSMDDIEKYGLGKLAVSQVVAVNLSQRSDFEGISEIAGTLGKYIPWMSDTTNSDALGVSVARTVALAMIETKNNVKDSVINGIIAPNCIIVIRTIAFILIFAIVSIVAGVIANLTKVINKVPVIGKVNALAGGLAGLCEGLVAVFVVCLITRFIVSLSGGNVILFNQTAIDSTYIFKRLYEFDFLNFLI